MTDWTLYRTFLAVLRTGSQSGAARRLGLAQPTVRRHLEVLERGLGRTLFLRSQSGLVPSALALSLRPAAEAMEAQAATIVRRAAASDGSGIVRISASRVIATEVLPAILADLHVDAPEINFEIDPSNSARDLLHQEADIAVRMTRPTQLELVQRYLGEVELGLFAHRSWLERHTPPENMAALAASRVLLGFDRDAARRAAWSAHMPGVTDRSFVLRCDDDGMLLQALRSGIGIGLCQVPIALRDPDLVRVLPEWRLPLGIWVVTHPDLRAELPIATVFERLADRLESYAHGLKKPN
ncbi:LysR family transcriptional regulator [Sagittula sp. NFXS13]|uniref:LysR family transcriptional regulator n=1 Tax=Sagittula sp. NFXS13 TaxID=2819095 RepID=UPI0032DFF935